MAGKNDGKTHILADFYGLGHDAVGLEAARDRASADMVERIALLHADASVPPYTYTPNLDTLHLAQRLAPVLQDALPGRTWDLDAAIAHAVRFALEAWERSHGKAPAP